MTIGIARIAYHLPEARLDNAALALVDPRFHAEKVAAKTGIDSRRIAAADETAGDLAIAAGRALIAEDRRGPEGIDYLILCTEAPDYPLPPTACIVHRALGLRPSAGAIDINLGCSGFVYGLGLAQGLITAGQAARVLLLTADTYSKFLAADDMSVRTIFGDAAAATLIEAGCGDLGPFRYGTDGAGAEHLIVPTGGARDSGDAAEPYLTGAGTMRRGLPLQMNGPEVFAFTIARIPDLVRETAAAGGIGLEVIDLFVFHQANATMLEALRRKLEIPPARFAVALDGVGNTVSSTIPITLRRYAESGRLKPGMRLMLVGFGVGYSWGACLATWAPR